MHSLVIKAMRRATKKYPKYLQPRWFPLDLSHTNEEIAMDAQVGISKAASGSDSSKT